ncbi:hypothetical protein [Shinella sp. BYT-45]|uniref:hypothetical protein n=1 Tax=Shinella sp. BYT-45 TaxID=3377377 RepID=UPI003981161A
MTKTLTTTFAAALVAASAFGASAAFASGDYYVGGAPDAVKSQNIDTVRTHSIGDKRVVIKDQSAQAQSYNSGDYRSVAPNASN